MLNKSLCILIFSICSASTLSFGADSVRLLSGATSVDSAVASAESENDEVLSGILPATRAWLHIQLANSDTSLLYFPDHSVDSYSIYSVQTGVVLESFSSPFRSENYIDWNPKFTLFFDRSWDDEFLIELQLRGAPNAPFSLLTFEQHQDVLSNQLISSGIFYGAIALMALFAFLLYALNKDKYAGFLSFSFFVWLLTMLSIWGFGASPMPLGLSDFLPGLANKLTILGTIAGAGFTGYFLKQVISGTKVYKVLYIGIWLQLAFFLTSFFVDPPWAVIILVNIIAGLLSLSCAALAAWRGDLSARYLFVSSALISSPYFFIFINPFNQQTIILVGSVALVMVMLAVLTRQSEQAKNLIMKAELANERERFLTSLSHEIRTPLNGIIGFSELANQENLQGNIKHYFELIDRSSKVLLGIVNEVLDYAKLQATEIKPNLSAINIARTLEDVITINRPLADENGIELSFHVDPALPKYVTTDPQRCLQILINLCGNAVKFSRKSSVKVTAIQEGDELVFRVIDKGIGIQPDVLAGLFNPFQQADASTARQFGGTGLGLAISKQLCELLGGSLSAVSEFGAGSTFTFRLPFIAAVEPKPENKIDSHSLAGKSVLIAEDNAINLILATQILKKYGLLTDSAENGRKAFELATQRQYDFILMDMQMPELSGTEATEKIREQGIETPIIAMTANTSESDRQTCLASGMDDYLAKPIDQQLLLEKLTLWSKN